MAQPDTPRPPRVYCSELARNAGSPLYGTAIEVDMWLMLEYPRPWKPKALEDNEFPAGISAHLARLAAELAQQHGIKLRVQFIKQFGSAESPVRKAWLADVRNSKPRMWRGEFNSAHNLSTIQVRDLHQFRLPASFNAVRQDDEEIYLVCTNGQRDVCCARFGLPLYESLRISIEHRVWQTTHLGGHRYAPNVLCLPSGVIYGFVAPEEGAAVVARHDAGELCLDKLRGRVGLTPLLQSAEYFLRRALGEASPQSDIELSAEFAEVTVMEDIISLYCTARVAGVQKHIRLGLRYVADAETALASCGAVEKSIGRYELLDLQLEPRHNSLENAAPE